MAQINTFADMHSERLNTKVFDQERQLRLFLQFGQFV